MCAFRAMLKLMMLILYFYDLKCFLKSLDISIRNYIGELLYYIGEYVRNTISFQAFLLKGGFCISNVTLFMCLHIIMTIYGNNNDHFIFSNFRINS